MRINELFESLALAPGYPVVDASRFTNVIEKKGELTLSLRWEHGVVVIEQAQRAFADPRALTPEDLSDIFFVLWWAQRVVS